jgi:hypothetical protein
VAWQGCVGAESAHQRNIEVANVSHMGMVHNPEVLRVVAGLLAEHRHGAFRTFIDTCVAKVFRTTEAKHAGKSHTPLSPPEPPAA